MNYLIVFCDTQAEIERLFEFVHKHEDEYKFVRKYRRAIGYSNKYDTKEDGRIFRCKDDKAEFRMRLMFTTKNYVI